MKKTLIAAAVGAVIAVPVVAQADVTLYGKFEPSLDYLNTNTTGGVTNGSSTSKSISGFSLNSSRWGVKGSEDLGDGLRALFQVESTISTDGKAALGNRNTFAGIAGGFGTVIAGRHDTPMKSLGRAVDLFGDQIGDSRNLISGKYDSSKGFDQRVPDMIAYVTPQMGGFKVVGQYGFDGGVKSGSLYSLLGEYKMGPMMVGLAYENHGKGLYNGSKAETGVRLAGSYKIGAFKLVGLVEQLTNLGGYQYIGNSSANPKAKATVYGFGGMYTMGSNAIKAQVYQANPDGSNNNSTMFAIGFDHTFSKRVMAFVDYAHMTNQSGAMMNVWGGGHSATYVNANNSPATVTVGAGKNPYAISTGMMIKF
ncbi:hypothetical protein BI364_01710 [Acidihalobacter yilgarnensis]|uniref:Porin domain-containing protein n=1 Tax=Acidihalobacter yilgarnensis TaxID=2819280 RepID=A0A1D8IKA5_9GAMM|nr:porin [Acidihalobacter yilgarnensis]AOU96892.1 hypothetical protein BI364_01710 [Acidihalobacter yilgarnensis]